MFCFAALLMMSGMVKAQTVTVANVEALPGETVSFSVSMSDGKADTYTALGFDIQFPSTSFSTTGGKTFSDSWPAATGAVGNVSSSAIARVGFYSSEVMTGNAIANLASVEFTVGSDVELGDYDVTLVNPTFEYGTSEADVANDITFVVHVVAAHSIVLDENSTVAPIAANGVNARVLRTIKADEWSTICLPFAMDATQVKAAFGDDVKLGDFTGYETTKEGENITNITVNFNSVTAIEANHPYIIKVSAAVDEFTADEVTIEPQEPKVSFGTTTGSGKNKVYHPSDFIGTYVADFDFYNEANSYPLFLNAGKFWYATESTKHMKAFRAYFDLYDYLPEAEPASAPIFISFNNDITGIKNIQRTAEDGKCYNLNGQRVVNPSKGLYIKNGKKVVVK